MDNVETGILVEQQICYTIITGDTTICTSNTDKQ